MVLHNPGGRARVFVCNVVVHSAVVPVAFTDLNLSGTMGAVDGIVLLKVEKTAHTVNTNYQFRPDGDASTMIYNGANYITALAMIGASALAVCKAIAGVVEWYSNNADACDVTLLAYAIG